MGYVYTVLRPTQITPQNVAATVPGESPESPERVLKGYSVEVKHCSDGSRRIRGIPGKGVKRVFRLGKTLQRGVKRVFRLGKTLQWGSEVPSGRNPTESPESTERVLKGYSVEVKHCGDGSRRIPGIPGKGVKRVFRLGKTLQRGC